MERLTIPDVRVDEHTTRRTMIDVEAVREHAMDFYWRLKAYEDTELTPEDVSTLAKDWSDLCTVLGECGGIDALRELAEADKDGRVVAFPENKTLTNADCMRIATNQQLAKQIYDNQKEICRMLYKNLGFEDDFAFSEDYSDILAWLNAPAKMRTVQEAKKDE